MANTDPEQAPGANPAHEAITGVAVVLRLDESLKKSPEVRGLAARLYRKGWSAAAIARRLAVNVDTVSRWLRQAHVPMRTTGHPEIATAEIVRLRQSGLTWRAVRHRLGAPMSERALRKRYRHWLDDQAGINTRTPNRKKTPELLDQVIALRHAGHSLTRIGHQISINRQTVSRWLEDVHIPPRPYVTGAEIAALRANGLTWPEIAAHCGLHKSTCQRRYQQWTIAQATRNPTPAADNGQPPRKPRLVASEIARLRDHGWFWPEIAIEAGLPPAACQHQYQTWLDDQHELEALYTH